MEEKKWKPQQDGAEREIQDRQNNKLIVQEKIESVNVKKINYEYKIDISIKKKSSKKENCFQKLLKHIYREKLSSSMDMIKKSKSQARKMKNFIKKKGKKRQKNIRQLRSLKLDTRKISFQETLINRK